MIEHDSNHLLKNDGFQYKLNIIVVMLLSVIFVLTDWIIYIFTFSELIILFLLFLFFLTNNLFLKAEDLYFLLIFSFLLTLNIVANEFFNPTFILRFGLAGMIKIIFFSIFILSTYRYIKKYKLEFKLLYMLNITAIVMLLFGIYIVMGISTESIPYEFLWSFTRTDKTSYFLMETIRMRSIFSEPAHFGYFLNIILGLNLFSDIKRKVSNWFSLIIIIAVMLTFSYSSVIITLVILAVKLFKIVFSKKKIKFNYKGILYLLLLAAALAYSWEFIYRTILLRSVEIFNGEDNSALSRFFDSWIYLNTDNIILGNGIGNSPPITNNFAYMLTDFGVFGFLISLLFSTLLIFKNLGLGILFILLNIQKGGYLSAAFAFLMLVLTVYTDIYEDMLIKISRIKRKFNL